MIKTFCKVLNVQGRYGQSVILTAALEFESGPTSVLKDRPVMFIVGPAAYVRTVRTNENSIATTSYMITLPPGEHTITARFEGDETFMPCEGTGTLTVIPGEGKADVNLEWCAKEVKEGATFGVGVRLTNVGTATEMMKARVINRANNQVLAESGWKSLGQGHYWLGQLIVTMPAYTLDLQLQGVRET